MRALNIRSFVLGLILLGSVSLASANILPRMSSQQATSLAGSWNGRATFILKGTMVGTVTCYFKGTAAVTEKQSKVHNTVTVVLPNFVLTGDSSGFCPATMDSTKLQGNYTDGTLTLSNHATNAINISGKATATKANLKGTIYVSREKRNGSWGLAMKRKK